MRLEMVDVFLFTEDNTDMTELVRLYLHPQFESLARLMISLLSEQLRSCHILKGGMETKTKKCARNSNGWQEVRHSHSIREACESR